MSRFTSFLKSKAFLTTAAIGVAVVCPSIAMADAVSVSEVVGDIDAQEGSMKAVGAAVLGAMTIPFAFRLVRRMMS
jgi:hypothetical protein